MDFVLSYGAWVLTPLHVLVCLVLIAVVLLQTGKGTDWAGMFGGSGTQTAFGPRGVENTLSRLTKIAAVAFMFTSLSLSLLQSKSRGGGGDLFKDLPAADKKSAAPSVSPVPGASPATETAPGATNAMPLTPSDAVPVEPAATPGVSNPAPAPATSPAGR